MPPKSLFVSFALLIVGITSPAFAQYAPAPSAYSMTQVFYPPSGAPVTMMTWRDGPAVLVQHLGSPSSSNYYDLASHVNYAWSSADPQCSANAFAGDWGNPFATADVAAELSQMHARETGTDIVNGIRTKVFDADGDGGGKYRVWLDATYGEEIKAVSIDANKKVTPLIVEVKSLTIGKPSVNLALPAKCAKVSIVPLPVPQPSEAQRLATLTGSAPGTYVSAINGPKSNETCSVQFSIAMAKTMATLNGGYRVALDPIVDPDHPATYAKTGNPFMMGGGLREVTGLLQNGVAKLPATGGTFTMQISHDESAAQYTFAATITRQCFGKSTAKLFYVVNSAASFEGGDWVWAK